jgi:predicted permease
MRWIHRLWNALRPGRVERDIERELSFHLAERMDDLRDAGFSEDDARRLARRAFGSPVLQAERTRDADVSRVVDTLLRDLRYALRTLARTPVFAASVVLTLALAIGANATVFSALDAVLFRPLPFPEPDRLVRVVQTQDRSSATLIAPPRLEDWNALNSTFDAIAGYYVEDASDTSGDLPERVRRAFVTPRFLEVWRATPLLGRGFSAGEHRFGGPAAVVISERYWRTRLAGRPDVLEHAVRLGRAALPIVGVMPSTFRYPERDVDLWSPVAVDAPYARSREATWYTGIGRLRQGVTPAQAREDLRALQAELARRHPTTDRSVGADVVPLRESTIGDAGSSLWLLFGAVSVLLLIACTNIAALLLSRGARRQHEIGIRVSLGASRLAVAGQMLTETAVLALAGGAGGLVVAAGACRAVRSSAADFPRIDELALDGRVLLYTAACTVAVALLCGVVPALRTARRAAVPGAGATRTQVSSRGALPWVLVGVQVAMSVTLLATAGLLVRSLHELSRVDPGFETRNVLTFRMSGSWGETSDRARLSQRIERTIDALAALPGVEAAASVGWSLPGVPEQWETAFELTEEGSRSGAPLSAEARAVSPEYFATMRIPVLAGEVCRRSDARVMVNRAFVRRYLADRPSPLGLHLRDAVSNSAPARIVGVVGDARERGLDRDPGPTVYWCISAPNPVPSFVLRTEGDPLAVARDVRVAMKALEPLRSVYELAPLEERIGHAYAENRLRTSVLALFAAAALSLAMVGLYGTLAYAVGQRRREVGLRLALGATRGRILSRFVGQGLRTVAIACAGGVALALATSRAIAGMLFGVSPSDPMTLGAVTVGVLAIAGLAVLVPAGRAAFLEPMQVLREQ